MLKLFAKLNAVFNYLGIHISRYPTRDTRRRFLLLKNYNISKVIDVGANKGEYVLELRKNGFNGDIYAFEPLSKIFERLKAITKNIEKIHLFNFALGATNEENKINISKNSASSSLLNMLSKHSSAEPNSIYVDSEIIKVRTLDSIFESIYSEGDRILLKIDTQGFEMNVLKGSLISLKNIIGIQVELSLVPLYEGSTLYEEIFHFLKEHGFKLCSIENGFADFNSGQLLQIDGIFYRTND
jgi:FkbM family methyltransferase